MSQKRLSAHMVAQCRIESLIDLIVPQRLCAPSALDSCNVYQAFAPLRMDLATDPNAQFRFSGCIHNKDASSDQPQQQQKQQQKQLELHNI